MLLHPVFPYTSAASASNAPLRKDVFSAGLEPQHQPCTDILCANFVIAELTRTRGILSTCTFQATL